MRTANLKPALAAIGIILLLAVFVCRTAAAQTDSKDVSKEVAALIELLQDEDKKVRFKAAKKLGEHGPQSKEAVPALALALGDESKVVRRAAAIALGKIGPDAAGAVPALIGALNDKNKSVRSKASAALYYIGLESRISIPVLIKLLEVENRYLLDQAKDKLIQIGTEAVPELIEALHNENDKIRREAIYILCRIKPVVDDVAPALIQALGDENVNVRGEAVIALDRLGPSAGEAVPALIKALKNENGWIQEAAISALEDLSHHNKEAASALVEVVLDDVSSFNRKRAATALGNIGPVTPEVVPALAAGLKDDSEKVRINAVEALGKIGPEAAGAVPALIEAVEHEENSAFAYLIWDAIGEIGPKAKDAVPALLAALDDADDFYQKLIVETLGKIGPEAKAAIPALLEARNPANTILVRTIDNSLKEIGYSGPEIGTSESEYEIDPLSDMTFLMSMHYIRESTFFHDYLSTTVSELSKGKDDGTGSGYSGCEQIQDRITNIIPMLYFSIESETVWRTKIEGPPHPRDLHGNLLAVESRAEEYLLDAAQHINAYCETGDNSKLEMAEYSLNLAEKESEKAGGLINEHNEWQEMRHEP